MSKPAPRRLLAVRLSSLGDLVHTLPVIPVLRSAFPDAELDWLADSRWAPLMRLVSGIDEVIPLGLNASEVIRSVRKVRQKKYFCAIDFQGVYRSAVMAWLSGAKRRIGREESSARERGAAKFYTERVVPSGTHVAEMSVSLALRMGAQPPRQMEFPLRVPPDEVEKIRAKFGQQGAGEFIVVSPGGGWMSKCWPPERFGALCAELWERHRVRAVINIAPGEDRLARETMGTSRGAEPIVCCAALPELVALLSQALLVVGGDTGPLHLAAALGTRVVALFGPTSADRNGPLPRGLVVQNQSAPLPNYLRGDYPRIESYSPEMLSITVAQVVHAVEQELAVAASTD